jgi:hypothetical protein
MVVSGFVSRWVEMTSITATNYLLRSPFILDGFRISSAKNIRNLWASIITILISSPVFDPRNGTMLREPAWSAMCCIMFLRALQIRYTSGGNSFMSKGPTPKSNLVYYL